jgi:hypothetical protein
VSAASVSGAVATVALIVLAVASPPARAAHWTEGQTPTAAPPGYSGEEYFADVSCPSGGGCFAVGEPNLVASSSDPTSGAETWKVVQPREAVPCEDNPVRCEPPPIELPPDFPPQYPPWQGRTATDVSCPTPSFCAATTLDGFIYTTHEPLGGADAWKVTDVDGDGPNTHLESISCPQPTFCVAVSGARHTAGRILSSADPEGGAAAWHEVAIDSFDLRGVSCGSPAFCIAVDHHGRVFRSLDPTGPASSWDALGTPGGPGALAGAECVGATLCLAGNAGGNVISTVDPLAPRPDWSEVNAGSSVQVTDISCPDAGHCLAVDNNGDTLTSTDPGGGPGSWSKENLIPYVERDENEFPVAPNAIFGVSCASTSLCVLAATERRILTSTDPFATPPSQTPRRKVKRPPKRPHTYLAHVDRFRSYSHSGRTRLGFRFFTKTKNRGFRCLHDGGHWRRCKSPHRYRLGIGKHAFRVRAIGPTGLKGPVAIDRFRVVDNNVCHPPHC